MTSWTPIVMAGLGAAAMAIDPELPYGRLLLAVLKAFVGAAAGAYFGNHIHERRLRRRP